MSGFGAGFAVFLSSFSAYAEKCQKRGGDKLYRGVGKDDQNPRNPADGREVFNP